MAYIYEHLKTDTWAYFSPFVKVTPNTYITNSPRLLYFGSSGDKADYKFYTVPVGTLITVDMEEVDSEQGYRRIFKFTNLPEMVPAEVTASLVEHYYRAPEEWQIWIDWSGLSDYVEPEPVEPEPEPDPIDPEPEPDPIDPEPVPANAEVLWKVKLGSIYLGIWKEKEAELG